jgi:hypothetical protein
MAHLGIDKATLDATAKGRTRSDAELDQLRSEQDSLSFERWGKDHDCPGSRMAKPLSTVSQFRMPTDVPTPRGHSHFPAFQIFTFTSDLYMPQVPRG